MTQTDILEGSRAAVNLITEDLRTMTPVGGNYVSNWNFYPGTYIATNPVNFFTLDNSFASCSYAPGGGTLLYSPLMQSLPGTGAARANVLNYFFVLGRNNQKWTGVGYVVNATNANPLFPLYRFYAETNIAQAPITLYWAFINAVNHSQWTNMSHVLDGVVHLTVRPYDFNGYWMTNFTEVEGNQWTSSRNDWFSYPFSGEVGCYFFSNTIPAAVELDLGVLEDRTLQRAESLGGGTVLNAAQTNYLWQQAGHVYLFRQRVHMPNVDPAGYQ
jgi:hypothetical protein